MHDSCTAEQVEKFAVSLANEQSRHVVDAQRLIAAGLAVLEESQLDSANVSLAVVDDATIHALNRRHLNHDWPTDVLSFVLELSDAHLDGEVIISADTAAAVAAEVGWSAAAEQLLYVIHGVLHLVGYRDKSPEEAREMRLMEAAFLRKFELEPPPGYSDHFGHLTGTASADFWLRGAKAR